MIKLGLTLQKIKESFDVQNYLYIASEKIRSKELRDQIETEILSHIESHVEDQMKVGVTLEQAIADALVQLGDAKTIRSGIYEANKSFYFRKRFYMPVSAVCLIAVVFIGTLEFYSRNSRFLLDNRVDRLKESLNLVMRDQKHLEDLHLFENQLTGLDFGTFANQQIDWSSNDIKSSGVQLTFPQVTLDTLKGLGEDWVSAIEQIDIDSIDLSWMSSLHKYNYWDLYQTGPGASFATFSKGNPFSIPVPRYSHFKGFAGIALLKGIRENKLENAIAQVEHLARLLYSNETLEGGIIAISILRDNLRAATFGKSLGLLSGKPLQYSSEDLERFRKVLMARSDYFDFINSKDTLAAVFSLDSGQKTSPGYCHALDEGIRTMTLYHRFFNGSYPYESDHTRSIAYIDSVMENSVHTCRIAPARFFWKERANIPDLSSALDVSFDPTRNIILKLAAKIPYLRKSVGHMLLATARPVFSEY